MIALQVALCGLVAVGLVGALLAHLSTFAGVDPQAEYGALVPLGVGALAAAGLSVGLVRWAYASGAVTPGDVGAARAPRWLTPLYLALGAYVVVGLVLWMEPERRQVSVVHRPDGTAYLRTAHGERYLREIDAEGIRWRGVYKARAVSGLLLGFYLGAAAAVAGAWRGGPDRSGRAEPAARAVAADPGAVADPRRPSGPDG